MNEDIPFIGNGTTLENYSFPASPAYTCLTRSVTNLTCKNVRFNGPFVGRTALFGLIRLKIIIARSGFQRTDFGSLRAFKVHFDNCTFESCTFGEKDIGSLFFECRFSECKFSRTEFLNADFSSCAFEDCVFEDCLASDCRWNDRGSARGVRFDGKLRDCSFHWKSADDIDFTHVRCDGEVALYLKAGSDVKLPTGGECVFVSMASHRKILDASIGLTSVSRVRLENILIGDSAARDPMAIDTSMLEGLPAEEVAAIMQTASRFALAEFPFPK